jgi:hypothetical protein
MNQFRDTKLHPIASKGIGSSPPTKGFEEITKVGNKEDTTGIEVGRTESESEATLPTRSLLFT